MRSNKGSSPPDLFMCSSVIKCCIMHNKKMLGDQTSVNMPTPHCLIGFTQSELLWKVPTNFLVLFFSGQSFAS